MIQSCKICGISDPKTLDYIINHRCPPHFIGFIVNYKKSPRYIEYEKLKKLIDVDKKKINFVAVLVEPNKNILEKIKKLNFDYYQLYNVTPQQTKLIKEKYKKKIISAITIKNKKDIIKYKEFESISDIILFDSTGYEKSIGFNHELLNEVPNTIAKMVGGNIQIDMNFSKLNEKVRIIDISGALETEKGLKDLKKIDIFLENINKHYEK